MGIACMGACWRDSLIRPSGCFFPEESPLLPWGEKGVGNGVGVCPRVLVVFIERLLAR